MGFTKKFTEDPLRDRVYLLVHSEPKVGKTYAALDLVRKHGHYVIMLSFDGGTMQVRQNPELFEKKLAIASPTTLQTLRDDMFEAGQMIERLYRAGVPRSQIWICVDTVNALQTKLMIEARKISVKNPDSRDSRREFVRDAVTEVDYNVNLAHMGEVADWLGQVPCNVLLNVLSKEEYVERKKTGRAIPSISGQSYGRFCGDADAILRLEVDREDHRTYCVDTDGGGDRSGYLEKREPADLLLIQRKMLGKHLPQQLPAPAASEENAPAVEAAEAS